jgi:hypothetical protein
VSTGGRYAAAPGVAAEIIEGEAVIINLETGVYHSMDRVGARVWEALAAGWSVEEIAAALSEATGVAAETAAGDVARVLTPLVDEGLLAPGADAAPGTALRFEPGEYASPALTSYRDMRDLLALDPPAPGLDGIAWNTRTPDSE